MITFSDSQQKIVDSLEAVNRAHWIDNHNGTISCSYCNSWFYKDNRYSYMHYCSYCGKKMDDKDEEVNTIEIPKNATNGDMIKAMFPDAEIKEIRGTFEGNNLLGYRTYLGGRSQDFLLDWWNAPFKRGDKAEMESEE